MHAGLADADEATRAVLEKVWEIEHRPARPHLTVVPPLPGETGRVTHSDRRIRLTNRLSIRLTNRFMPCLALLMRRIRGD